MRELKFRVWSNEQKTYDYKFPYNFVGDFYVSSHGVIYSDFGNTIVPEVRQDAFIIEQYTGLKDENGKEIYEGDIVTLNGEWEEIEHTDCYIVTFKDGCFRIGDDYDNEVGSYLSDWRVIGNIHENFELCGEGTKK